MEGTGAWDRYWIEFQPDGDKLRFKLEAASGTHKGLIEGSASLKRDLAVFEERQDWNDDGTARVTFQRSGESIVVTSTNTRRYGGMGISFAKRIYLRGPAREDPFPLSQGPRPLFTGEEEARLKKLVGSDFPLLVGNLHLALDMPVASAEFRGKQVDGFVQGMAKERLAIILVDEQGRIAAAVTDPKTDEIRLYSQLPSDEIPFLMLEWRALHVDQRFRWVKN